MRRRTNNEKKKIICYVEHWSCFAKRKLLGIFVSGLEHDVSWATNLTYKEKLHVAQRIIAIIYVELNLLIKLTILSE